MAIEVTTEATYAHTIAVSRSGEESGLPGWVTAPRCDLGGRHAVGSKPRALQGPPTGTHLPAHTLWIRRAVRRIHVAAPDKAGVRDVRRPVCLGRIDSSLRVCAIGPGPADGALSRDPEGRSEACWERRPPVV